VDNGRSLVDTTATNNVSAVYAVVLWLEIAVPAALPQRHHAAAAVAGQVDLRSAGHVGRAMVLLLRLLVARGGG
jgi:hypothetical protein